MGEETRAMLGEIDDLRKDCQQLQAENERLKSQLSLVEKQCQENGGNAAARLMKIEGLKKENEKLKAKTISSTERELANQCIKFTKQSEGGFTNIPLGWNLSEDIGLITQAEQALREDE